MTNSAGTIHVSIGWNRYGESYVAVEVRRGQQWLSAGHFYCGSWAKNVAYALDFLKA